MTPHIRAATLDDVEPVARAMRLADANEVRASSGRTPFDALKSAVESSTFAWTAEDSTGPFCIFGVAPFVADSGSPWLLATDRMRANRRALLAYTLPFVEAMLNAYPVLINFVDARNLESMRWLRWAGFRFTGYEPHYGFERRAFFRFSKVRE